MVTIKGKPIDINIIQVYAPTTSSSDEEIQHFYDEIEMAMAQIGSQEYLVILMQK